MNDQENVIVGKGEKTKAIQDHLIEDGHHDEAEAFSVVDFLVREYLLCPKDDLHEGAFKIRELLSDIVGAWQPRQPEQAIAAARTALTHLGGSILTNSSGLSPYISDHRHAPKNPPVRWWREICGKIFDTEDAHKRWAVETKRISDMLPAVYGSVTPIDMWNTRQPEQAIAEKVLNWFANSRVGLSSKTMAMVACGIIPDEVHHPYDPDDLSRCIVLLDMVPEVRNHFDAISDLNNKWASLIQHWDEIESAYREEDAFGWSRVKRPSKTYTMMRNVLAVCEGGGA